MKNEPTIFRIPIDDETMESVLEQSVLAKRPPREVIAAVVRDVFAFAKSSGIPIFEQSDPVWTTKH